MSCPGDTIDETRIQWGLSWQGDWDIQQQQENAQKAEALLVGTAEIAAGVAWEPADWAIAMGDGFQWYDALGMLPLIPAGLGDDLVQGGSVIINGIKPLKSLPPPIRKNYPWHHLFPKRRDLAILFTRAGINIEEHLAEIPIELHKAIHGGGARGGWWNQAWEQFFRDHPKATAKEIYEHLGWLIYKFELDGKIKLGR